MAQQQTRGACVYCGRELTCAPMARHLRTCKKREEAIAAANAQRGKAIPLIHLQVRSDIRAFWLQLEMNGSATLDDLDDYLRAIWLECCGHMSEFSADGWGTPTFEMDRKAAQVFQRNPKLTHIYDFGTESFTHIEAVARREGKPLSKHPIVLMARNEPPAEECQECGRPAQYLCIECFQEPDLSGTLCPAHAKSHPHDEYGEPLPLVNSPRLGLCGYTGPADPPY